MLSELLRWHSSQVWPNFRTCQRLFILLGLAIFAPSTLTHILCWATKCKHAAYRRCAFSPHSNEKETSKDSVCMCAEDDNICRHGQTTERLGRKRGFHWNCMTCIMSWIFLFDCSAQVSLANNYSANSVCEKLTWCCEDFTSLSEATADKHLPCCLHTSGAAQTVRVSAQNSVQLHNKLRERAVVGQGSQPVDWPSLYLDKLLRSS